MTKRHFISGLAATALALSIAANAQQEMRITVETDTVSNSISGPGAASSTLSESGSYSQHFSINSVSSSDLGQLTFDLGIRNTNDARVDPTIYSLTNARMRMTAPGRTLNVGDTFESFSQYSMSSAVKGLSFKLDENRGRAPEMTFVYGYAYPRWDGFNPSDETRSIKRIVYGARAKRSISPFLTAGLSAVRSDDSERVYATDTLYAVNSYALDWEYRPFSDLSIRGESCVSSADLAPGGGTASESEGHAHRLVVDGNTGIVRLVAEYEKVSPGFYSTMGSATRDREKAKLRWKQKQSPTRTVNYGFLWFRDNLSANKAYTTQNFRPEIGYTFRSMFGRRYATADVNLMVDRRYGGPNSTTNKHITAGYRDRFGTYDTDFSLGYTDYDSRLQSHNKEYLYSVNLTSRSTRGGTILRPNLSLGGSTVSDELADLTDQIWNYSAGLLVEVPDRDFRTNFSIGRNKLDNGQGNDSAKWYGSLDVRYSPEWLARYNAESIYLKAFVNRYTYSINTDNFRETGLIGGLSLLY